MDVTPTDPDRRRVTRESLQRVAVHIVARARVQATGRFSLRVAPGGFGTPEFGDAVRRIRVSGGSLIVEQDAAGAPASTTVALHGSTLAELAVVAGVDLAAPLDVGHDTPPVGDIDAPLVVHGEAAHGLAAWLHTAAVVLDRVVGITSTATPVRLWPEHFDVAFDGELRQGVRANVGGSPGDGFSDEPYLYVGPWTADRPGDADYWNAPFGAFVTAGTLGDEAAAVAFLSEGLRRLQRG